MALGQPALGISTYWNRDRHDDMAAAIQEIVGLSIETVEVEVKVKGEPLTTAAQIFQQKKALCSSVVMGREAVGPMQRPTLFHNDPAIQQVAMGRLERSIKSTALLKSKTLVLDPGPVISIDCETKLIAFGRAIENQDDEAARKGFDELYQERRLGRDAGIEKLCRVLHTVLRENSGLTIAVVPNANPLALLGFEESGWLLEDLGKGIALRLDPASIAIRERYGRSPLLKWAESFANRIETTYLSEPNGFRADSLPGPGLINWSELASRLSPQTTSILKVDPASSTVAVEQAIRSFGRGLV